MEGEKGGRADAEEADLIDLGDDCPDGGKQRGRRPSLFQKFAENERQFIAEQRQGKRLDEQFEMEEIEFMDKNASSDVIDETTEKTTVNAKSIEDVEMFENKGKEPLILDNEEFTENVATKRAWGKTVLKGLLYLFVLSIFLYFLLCNLKLLLYGVQMLFMPLQRKIKMHHCGGTLDNHLDPTNRSNIGTDIAPESCNTVNPIWTYFFGQLSATLLQSSSATTSLLVSAVAADDLTVRAAFPFIGKSRPNR